MGLGHRTGSQFWSQNRGHESELFGPNQTVERAWIIIAPAVPPAHQQPRQPRLLFFSSFFFWGVYNIRPLETKGIDIFLLGGQLTCVRL